MYLFQIGLKLGVPDKPVIFFFFTLVFYLFFSIYFYQLEANYFIILQWFLSYIDMNQPWIYMYSPSRSHLPPPSPPDSSGSSQCTKPLIFRSFSKLDFTYMTWWQQWVKTLSLERNMNFSGTLQDQISQSFSIILLELDYILAWSQLFFIL